MNSLQKSSSNSIAIVSRSTRQHWYKLSHEHDKSKQNPVKKRRPKQNRLLPSPPTLAPSADPIAQSRRSVQSPRSWPSSTSSGAGRLRSSVGRGHESDRTVEASSPSSTTEADEAQSLWQSASAGAACRGDRGFAAARLRCTAAAAALDTPARGPLEDSTVELEA